MRGAACRPFTVRACGRSHRAKPRRDRSANSRYIISGTTSRATFISSTLSPCECQCVRSVEGLATAQGQTLPVLTLSIHVLARCCAAMARGPEPRAARAHRGWYSLSGFSGFSTVKSHPNCRCYRQTLPVPSPATIGLMRIAVSAVSGFQRFQAFSGLALWRGFRKIPLKTSN